jgi:UDP-2-acetamido-3-amino-2,3-dideoxy-glucuronate N-acetyltransferase
MWIHPSAVCDPGCQIGEGTRIWHFSHVMTGAQIGRDCSIGQGCFVAGGAILGDRVRLQNHVSVFDGVCLEDDVFCGPSVVFTNVVHPRAEFPVKPNFERTLVARGVTLGANSTILCGVQLGTYSFVAAGAVVTRDVAPYVLVVGVPAQPVGWVSKRAQRLSFDEQGVAYCPMGGDAYVLAEGIARPKDAE